MEDMEGVAAVEGLIGSCSVTAQDQDSQTQSPPRQGEGLSVCCLAHDLHPGVTWTPMFLFLPLRPLKATHPSCLQVPLGSKGIILLGMDA